MLKFFNSLTTEGKIKYIICLPFFIPLYVFVCIGKYANKLNECINDIMYKYIKDDGKC